MPRPRSVLIVVDTLTDNGGLRWVHKLAGLWLDAGWSVGYLSLKAGIDGRPPLMPPAGTSLTYGDTVVRRFRNGIPRALVRSVRAVASADAVLAVSEVGLALPWSYAMARLLRRPFAVYVQNIPERSHDIHLRQRDRPLWRHCLVRADAVLCVSSAGAESAARMGVEPSRITVAPTGIDVDAVRRLGSVAGTGGTARTADSLVACGELFHRKGFDLLIRALAVVRSSGRDVRLTIIGQGEEGPELQRLVHDLGLSDAVTFAGHVPNSLPEIAGATAFVHCARVEGVPQVLLEALALGVPTIATDCDGGGPSMILGGGKYGRLVEPESVPAVAEAITAHLADPSQLARQAAEGEAHLRERFSPARTATIVLDVLDRLCRARARPRRSRRGSRSSQGRPPG
ncbi:glycosyltransferase [Geodermatophilus sp. CPCC 205761]|uniref:glycosyltransferase n=1 Tax=Geodermatophilus sp. CPCC 205761 TaxID=2936597 RepID=UPI003EF057FF